MATRNRGFRYTSTLLKTAFWISNMRALPCRNTSTSWPGEARCYKCQLTFSVSRFHNFLKTMFTTVFMILRLVLRRIWVVKKERSKI